MSYKICRSYDYELIASLNDAIFVDKLYDIEEAHWWVVWYEGVPVAFAGVKEHTPKYAFLYRAGVLEEHRGHKLQRKLVRVRKKWAKQNNFIGLVTYTLVDNISSYNNLIKEGFLGFTPKEPWHAEDEDVLYWILEFGN